MSGQGDMRTVGTTFWKSFVSNSEPADTRNTAGKRLIMSKSAFTYVTYIRTTPEKLWSALTDLDLMKQYWFGVQCECQWTAGSPWKLTYPDGRITDAGEIVEAKPP